MGSYKLLYFDGYGRGEAIRMAFKVAGVDFVDERIPKAEWPKIKPTTPCGHVPVLYTPEGFQLVESMAILRYVGRKFGLAGKTEMEMYEVDRTLDQVKEFLDNIVVLVNKSHEEKVQGMKAFLEGKGGELLCVIQNILKAHTSVVASGLTIADFSVAYITLLFKALYSNHLKNFPLLVKHLEFLEERAPKLKEGFIKHPLTDF